MANIPDRYPNPRGDNAWDNDAAHWLLEHEDVTEHFDRHNLMECARRQRKRLENDLDRVILAAQLCERHGVVQVEVFDRSIGKTVWRLQRTDPDAPEYPDYGAVTNLNHAMGISAEDSVAAERLLQLIPDYEAELRANGKAANTIFTYVDRAERFLRRVSEGERDATVR